jgi:hypothetical protein
MTLVEHNGLKFTQISDFRAEEEGQHMFSIDGESIGLLP